VLKTKRPRNDASETRRKIPVIDLEFPVLQKKFPDSLLRELFERSLQQSGFLLYGCRIQA
jgi:hypothetical protein